MKEVNVFNMTVTSVAPIPLISRQEIREIGND